MNRDQSRTALLLSLCGITDPTSFEELKLTPPTKQDLESSVLLDDPLLQYYQTQPPSRNAAHLQLVSTKLDCNAAVASKSSWIQNYFPFYKIAIEHEDLVQPDQEHPAALRKISESYQKAIGKLWKILDTGDKRKQVGFIALLNDLFYRQLVRTIWNDSFTIAEALFLEKLYTAYSKGEECLPTSAYDKAKEELTTKLRQGAYAITPSRRKVIEDALVSLPERERQIFTLLYPATEPKRRVKEVGRQLGVSETTISQYKARGRKIILDSSHVTNLAVIATTFESDFNYLFEH